MDRDINRRITFHCPSRSLQGKDNIRKINTNTKNSTGSRLHQYKTTNEILMLNYYQALILRPQCTVLLRDIPSEPHLWLSVVLNVWIRQLPESTNLWYWHDTTSENYISLTMQINSPLIIQGSIFTTSRLPIMQLFNIRIIMIYYTETPHFHTCWLGLILALISNEQSE